MSSRIEEAVQIAREAGNRFWDFHSDDALIIFEVLLAAEDRHGGRHMGVDWVSLFRAIMQAPRRGRIEGLSTIEQQLARTIVPRKNNHLLRNKLFELRLARSLAARLQKRTIWAAYLELAYYGARLNCYRDARLAFLGPMERLNYHSASKIVACLKYPRPREGGERWMLRHQRRVEYISAYLTRTSRHRGPESAEHSIAWSNANGEPAQKGKLL